MKILIIKRRKRSLVEYQREKSYIFQLLNSILCDSNDKNFQYDISELNWEYIYKLCSYHKIDNIIAYKVCSDPISTMIPQNIVNKFKLSMQKAKAREAVQEIEYEQILQSFEEQGIKNIPLKGSVLKYYYPSPDMRFMVDLDILCQEEDMEKSGEVLKKLGYKIEHQGGDHDVYSKLPYTVIELHRTCYTYNEILDKYFSKIWSRSQKREGKNFTYDITWDDYYLFLIAHMIKHFSHGGIGVRSLLDLIIFKEKLEKNCNRLHIESILKDAGILKVEKKMNQLAQECFYGKENSQTDELMNFIWESGLQGTSKNSISVAIVKKGGKKKILKGQLKQLLSYIFLEKKQMQKAYPYLKKYPFLLPIAWIHRGIYKLIFKRKRVFNIIKKIFNRKNANKIIEIHKEAGLD